MSDEDITYDDLPVEPGDTVRFYGRDHVVLGKGQLDGHVCFEKPNGDSISFEPHNVAERLEDGRMEHIPTSVGETLSKAVMDIWMGYDDFKEGGLPYVAWVQQQNVEEMMLATSRDEEANELADQAIIAIRQLCERGYDPEGRIRRRLNERMAGNQEDIIETYQDEYDREDVDLLGDDDNPITPGRVGLSSRNCGWCGAVAVAGPFVHPDYDSPWNLCKHCMENVDGMELANEHIDLSKFDQEVTIKIGGKTVARYPEGMR